MNLLHEMYHLELRPKDKCYVIKLSQVKCSRGSMRLKCCLLLDVLTVVGWMYSLLSISKQA